MQHHRLRQPAVLVIAVLGFVGVFAAAAYALPSEGSLTPSTAEATPAKATTRDHGALAQRADVKFRREVRAEREAEVRLAYFRQVVRNRQAFALKLHAYKQAEAAKAAADQAASEARSARQASNAATPQASGPSTGRCGGDLPPCCVMNRESGGNIRAQNPSSSASGKWQFVNGTWNNFGGYPTAASAPESVQDAKARQLWAGGAGASHWGGGC